MASLPFSLNASSVVKPHVRHNRKRFEPLPLAKVSKKLNIVGVN